MSSRVPSLFSRARSVWKTIFRKGESPRQLQERSDLYKAIFLSKHCALRMERMADLGRREFRDDVKALADKTIDQLETEMEPHNKSIVGLRYELQNLLSPQTMRMFEAFRAVDENLPASASNEEIMDLDSVDDASYKAILLDEYSRVCADLKNESVSGNIDTVSSVGTSAVPYLTTKRGALQTVLYFRGWLDKVEGSNTPPESTQIERSDSVNMVHPTPDDFGYYAEGADSGIDAAVRHHQMINLSKAALLKQDLGFSILALRSTIPDAGRGVFIDGTAMAGSLLAFFPGEVWPKEHLTTNVFDSSMFKDDPKHQLSIRYDDILVDSRKASYTVLNSEKSNPFAIAHIANHPTEGLKPNCHTVAVNLTEKMELEKTGLARYVPNTYARPPMFMGPKALDRDVIVMHGFALMAARDVSHEELVYDYRMSPGEKGSYPSWYYPCDSEELRNRWWED